MLEFSIDHIAVTQFVVATLFPLAVGIVTTKLTQGWIKSILLASIALLSGLGAEAVRTWQDGGSFDVGVGLIAGLPAWVIAATAHTNFWKPIGATDAVQEVGVKDRIESE